MQFVNLPYKLEQQFPEIAGWGLEPSETTVFQSKNFSEHPRTEFSSSNQMRRVEKDEPVSTRDFHRYSSILSGAIAGKSMERAIDLGAGDGRATHLIKSLRGKDFPVLAIDNNFSDLAYLEEKSNKLGWENTFFVATHIQDLAFSLPFDGIVLALEVAYLLPAPRTFYDVLGQVMSERALSIVSNPRRETYAIHRLLSGDFESFVECLSGEKHKDTAFSNPDFEFPFWWLDSELRSSLEQEFGLLRESEQTIDGVVSLCSRTFGQKGAFMLQELAKTRPQKASIPRLDVDVLRKKQ